MNALARLVCIVMSAAFAIAASTPAPAAATATPASSYSATDLYNTANAYARQGKPGLAILNYERARLLAPDDPDIEANLDFVRRSSGLPPTTEGRAARFTRTVERVDPDLYAWIGLAGLILAGTCWLSTRRHPAQRWKLRGGVLVGLTLVGATLVDAFAIWPTLHEGIVLAAATPARVAPVPMGDALFVLQEAQAVRIAAIHEGFFLVESRDGQMGWVAQSNLGAVVPR